ncbi:hypothetical protein H6G80_22020 [Nostoc sp. FACHB-87]|uniref:O-methyltransferase n=1 Tax=Nostocaceae TaxID=1162 RepID=UPI001686AB71|nr:MULTISPECIES: O-methyltransferase [Nostocaceae]MBD2456744.1 hypothetical protein [Nostoc sp. FACHB-87]MBD2476487.1 hypothetical protein [Anabaena sp. FACHB-83]
MLVAATVPHNSRRCCKEIQHLDSQMPTDNCDAVKRICIPLKDVKSYAELYKYFPSFVEMLM